MTEQLIVEVEAVKVDGDYYGDFYYDEEIVKKVLVHCLFCTHVQHFEGDDGEMPGLDFTCKCGIKWEHVEDETFKTEDVDDESEC